MLAQMLGMEAGTDGVRVNAVCPGDTAPGMATHVDGRADLGETSGWLLPPAGRIGTAEDVAGAVSFFVSPDSAFCNGSILLVDGGMRAAVRREPGHELMYGLDGRVALVTGGTSGIGKSCVERLRAEGMTVVFTGRNVERGSAVAEETGADVPALRRPRPGRLRPGGRRDAPPRRAGGSTCCSRTPASSSAAPIEHTPEPAFLELLEVNLTSLFRTSRACFGPMRDQGGGSMIHLASDSGIRGVHEIAGVLRDEGRRDRRLRAVRGRGCAVRRPRQCRLPGRRDARASRRRPRATASTPRIRAAGRCRPRAGSAPGRMSQRSSPGSPPTSRRT